MRMKLEMIYQVFNTYTDKIIYRESDNTVSCISVLPTRRKIY